MKHLKKVSITLALIVIVTLLLGVAVTTSRICCEVSVSSTPK